MSLKKITSKKFRDEILSGERFLAGIELKDPMNFIHFIDQLNDYLREEDLENDPLDLSCSNLTRINAEGIYFPHTAFYNTNLTQANLQNSFILNCNLACANLNKTDFRGSNLWEAKLLGSDLTDAVTSETYGQQIAGFKKGDFTFCIEKQIIENPIFKGTIEEYVDTFLTVEALMRCGRVGFIHASYATKLCYIMGRKDLIS